MAIWKNKDDKFLKDNYCTMDYWEMAERLGRTKEAVKMRCYHIGLNKKNRGWTAEQDQYLKEHYNTKCRDELANYFKKSKHTLYQRAAFLGIQKVREPYRVQRYKEPKLKIGKTYILQPKTLVKYGTRSKTNNIKMKLIDETPRFYIFQSLKGYKECINKPSIEYDFEEVF